jgi:hypothetical protein
MAITCGVSPFIIFGSIFKEDPLRDTGVLLIFKALCFSIGYNIIARITKQLIKPIVKPAISDLQCQGLHRSNGKPLHGDLLITIADLHAFGFHSRNHHLHHQVNFTFN